MPLVVEYIHEQMFTDILSRIAEDRNVAEVKAFFRLKNELARRDIKIPLLSERTWRCVYEKIERERMDTTRAIDYVEDTLHEYAHSVIEEVEEHRPIGLSMDEVRRTVGEYIMYILDSFVKFIRDREKRFREEIIGKEIKVREKEIVALPKEIELKEKEKELLSLPPPPTPTPPPPTPIPGKAKSEEERKFRITLDEYENMLRLFHFYVGRYFVRAERSIEDLREFLTKIIQQWRIPTDYKDIYTRVAMLDKESTLQELRQLLTDLTDYAENQLIELCNL